MPRNAKSLTLVCTAGVSRRESDLLRKKVSALLATPAMQEQFLKATELVDRNYITTRRTRILSELRQSTPRSFRFFINKN
jgi:hypothetical protein